MALRDSSLLNRDRQLGPGTPSLPGGKRSIVLSPPPDRPDNASAVLRAEPQICDPYYTEAERLDRLTQFRSTAGLLIVAVVLFQIVACTGYIQSPTPPTPPPPTINSDLACPTMIPDQATNICPRLKNITLTCGGNGMLHTSVGGGSGKPFLLGVKLDNGSVLSAVLVTQLALCQDGPREGVTLGVTYTGQVSIPPTGPPCISTSKAVYPQFDFGDPHFDIFKDLAQDTMHQTLDDQAITSFASAFGLAAPAMSRCSFWHEMP
jgi:hypothetical protein